MLEPEKCCITRYPAKVLSSGAKPIDDVNDDIRKLADKMIDIMIENKGVGLAGPQAGVDLRIFVISLDGTRDNAKVYINPTIKPSGGLEGCQEGWSLALPGIQANIKRFRKCTVDRKPILTATSLPMKERGCTA